MLPPGAERPLFHSFSERAGSEGCCSTRPGAAGLQTEATRSSLYVPIPMLSQAIPAFNLLLFRAVLCSSHRIPCVKPHVPSKPGCRGAPPAPAEHRTPAAAGWGLPMGANPV